MLKQQDGCAASIYQELHGFGFQFSERKLAGVYNFSKTCAVTSGGLFTGELLVRALLTTNGCPSSNMFSQFAQ